MTQIEKLIADLQQLSCSIGDEIVEEVVGDALTELQARVDVLVAIADNLDAMDVTSRQHWFHSKRKAIGENYPNGFHYRTPVEVLYTALKNRRVWAGDQKQVAHFNARINNVIELSKKL
jgi:hypothetical protein